MAAPVIYRTHGETRLNDDVGEVYFPDWSRRGWRPVGQRVDRLGDRRAVTVYYRRGSTRIAYTILAAPALDRPATPKRWLHGVELESFISGDRMIVTWQRTGHTCVLSGAGVRAGTLAQLALSTVLGGTSPFNAPQGGEDQAVSVSDRNGQAKLSAQLFNFHSLSFSSGDSPKSLEVLESVPVPTITGAPQDLRGLVNFGFFGVIARPLFLWLKWTYKYVHNWGWAIVVHTLIINLALLPGGA